jgi:putative SOS response-associated peptidase YedK
MCGRYLIEDTDDGSELGGIIAEAQRCFETRPDYKLFMAGDIAPGCLAPALFGGGGARFMLWGFPSLVSGRRPHINARSETAATMRTFAASMASRRCILPASGYYEWKPLGGKRKERYRFTLPGGGLLYMAGIHSPDGRFAILTRDAAPSIRGIHDRMPVILTKPLAQVWLTETPDVLWDAVTDVAFAPDEARGTLFDGHK